MNYTINQLRIFVKVCEYQSVTKAAEAMFLTQPAISIQLKKLQDEFDVALTEVIGRRIFITDFGREVEKLAKDILDKLERMQGAANDYKGLLTGQLKIASASTGKYVIPYFLTGFMRKYPGVSISIDVTNKTRVVESLQANTIDFAMVSVIPPNIPLEKVPLLKNELNLVAAAKFPKLPKRMTHKKLSEQTLIFREKGSATRETMTNYLSQHQIEAKQTMYLVSNEAVKQAVQAGLGLSILPLIGIQKELLLETMRIIPIKGLPIFSEWNLVYGKGKQLLPAGKALIHYLNEHKQRIITDHFGNVS
ncbi:MAG: LysR substrate-binding domain-containing protein [Saprospiraceae bacterium]